jgi:pyroglutamyl-peptidase
MRLLIYGFRPYRQYKENITEKIIKRLPKRRGLRRVVFPVRFQKGQFIEAVKKYKPDVILGLGQCSRGRRLRIETRAVNKRRNDRKERKKPIVPGGSRWLSTNLKMRPGRQARISHDAGGYVCNFSIYVILDFLKHRNLATRFGFIHISRDYSLARAQRFLLRAARNLQTP